MRIPTSTIVMGLVTCVPFALAIRAGTSSNRPVADEEQEDAEAVLAREAQMRADEQAERMREEQQVAEDLHRLYGTQPGTPGALFRGVVFGGDATPETERVVREYRRATIELETDDHGLSRISITPRRALCDTLDTKLDDTWGRGIVAPAGRIWLDPATGQRALFSHSYECSLVFDRFVTADAWITKTTSSVVPVWAIGQPADKLVDSLNRPPSEAKQPTIEWTGPGIGASGDVTHLTAQIDHGKVVGLVVTSAAPSGIYGDVRNQLVAVFGEPKAPPKVTDENVLSSDVERWDGKLPVLLEATDSGFRVSIGAPAKN